MENETQLFLQFSFNGLALGCIYALIALGFVIIFKATKVLNFAQGELMMAGAYFCLMLSQKLSLNFILAFIITLAFSAVLGLMIQFIVLKKMLGEPIFSVVMVTIGLASVLKSVIGLIWKHDIQRIPSPFPIQPIKAGSIIVSHVQIWTIALSVFFIILLLFFFKYTSMGLGMRATAEDQDTSLLMGINVNKVFTFAWVISAVVASVGGIFLGTFLLMTPEMSFVGLKAFPAVILGGLESIGGAIIGGIAIGIIENYVGGYIDSVFKFPIKEIAAYIVLFIVLMIRPYGLFGQKEIERV